MTREKALRAAETLRYRSPAIPKIMLTGQSGIFAVIGGGFQNPFVAEALEGFTRAFRATGRQTLLAHLEGEEKLEALVDRLHRY